MNLYVPARAPGHEVVPAPVPIGKAAVPNRDATGSPARDRVAQAVAVATDAYALSKRYSRELGSALTGDPGWNMLLDLFLSRVAGRDLSVTAVCLGSQAAAATALRYLSRLQEAGYVERTADRRDRRRCYVTLTDQGFGSMVDMLCPARSPTT